MKFIIYFAIQRKIYWVFIGEAPLYKRACGKLAVLKFLDFFMKNKLLLLLLPGLLLLTGCSQVEVRELAQDEFELSLYRDAPPMSFESRAMRKQAEQLCPTGYRYLLRQAVKQGEFATHHAECAAGKDCGHQLEWRIRCGNVPREPFSLFGRT